MLVKFMFSEKATKKDKTSTLDLTATKAKLFQEATFFVIIFTYLKTQVQNDNAELDRLVQCLKCVKVGSLSFLP